MNKYHEIKNISFDGNMIHLSVDGMDYKIDVSKISRRLARATPVQKNNFEISPAGYGVHWPDIDEDLSIDAIIGVNHAPSQFKLATV